MIRGVNATIIVVSESAPGVLSNTRGIATTIDSPAASFADELTSNCSVAGTCTVNPEWELFEVPIGKFAKETLPMLDALTLKFKWMLSASPALGVSSRTDPIVNQRNDR